MQRRKPDKMEENLFIDDNIRIKSKSIETKVKIYIIFYACQADL